MLRLRSKKKATGPGVVLPVLITILVISLYYMQAAFIETLEAKTYDFRFKTLRGPIPPGNDVAIVAIDEKSMEELGRFPWSRKNHGRLIDVLSQAGAKAIVFDVFFPEGESRAVDGEFASAIRRSGRTTLPVAFGFSEDGAADVIENIPELTRAAKNIGHMNVVPDEDGVLRWTPLVISYKDKYYPSIALAGAKEAMGADEIKVKEYGVAVGGAELPTDGRHWMLINYRGPAGIYQRYSYSDVLRGRIGAEKLRGKVIIVGATALGVYDLRVTPYSNNTPGIEVSANVIDNILGGDFLRRGPYEAVMDMSFIAVIAFLSFFAAIFFSAEFALPVMLLILGGYGGLSHYFFLKGHWISVVYPALSATLTFTAASAMRFLMVEKKAKEIKTMFSSYVSRKVVDELVKYPERAKVGGELKTITILFSDIRGFTSFSEKRRPEEVVDALNEYLSVMTDVIMQHDGTLDKFLGDGILAFWGAPLEQENQAELAARCSLQMLKRLKGLHGKWHSENREELSCGIGIHTGEAIVGNIGAKDKKMEYTAIGDNVNLASRVQGVTRTVDRTIVITEALYERIRSIAVVEPLGKVAVKGRTQEVNVFALGGMRDETGTISLVR